MPPPAPPAAILSSADQREARRPTKEYPSFAQKFAGLWFRSQSGWCSPLMISQPTRRDGY